MLVCLTLVAMPHRTSTRRVLETTHCLLSCTLHVTLKMLSHCNMGVRQRSGEGVVRRNGTVVQKGVLESPFLLFPLKVFRCYQGKPYWGREETDSPKTPFWTTVSPHDAFSASLAPSDNSRDPTWEKNFGALLGKGPPFHGSRS